MINVIQRLIKIITYLMSSGDSGLAAGQETGEIAKSLQNQAAFAQANPVAAGEENKDDGDNFEVPSIPPSALEQAVEDTSKEIKDAANQAL